MICLILPCSLVVWDFIFKFIVNFCFKVDFFLGDGVMKVINKVAAALVLSIPLLVSASDNPSDFKAKVTWGDFNDFTDVRPNGGPKGAFHKQVKKSFENHFAKLAKKLPHGYKLRVKVNDLDLAGDVRFSSVNEMRVVKPIYFPKIKFSYVLS